MRRRWLMFVVAVAGIVVIAEGAARAIESSGPPNVRWYDAAAQLKVEQMEAAGGANTVFAGTSMAWQAFVPSVFADEMGLDDGAFNAGLAGGVPIVMEPWLIDEVVPRLRPDRVVWGLSSLDFSSSYGESNRAAYDDALETRSGVLAGIERATARVSALVRYRAILRDPGELAGNEAAAARDDYDDALDTLGGDGERLDFARDLSAQRRRILSSRVKDFSLDAGDVASVLRTADALGRRGIEVVFVALPVPQRFVELHPGGLDDLVQTEQAVRELAQATGSRFVDLSDGFVDANFVDFTHLDAGPAKQLTERLAAELLSGGAVGGAQSDPREFATSAAALAAEAIEMNDIAYHHLSGRKGAFISSEFWYNFVHYGHVQDLAAFAASGTSVDTLIAGSSLAYYDINTAVYARRTDRTAYNVGMSSAGPELNQHWLLDVAVPLSQPNRVIWTASPRSFRETKTQGCLRGTASYETPLARQQLAFRDASWLRDVERSPLFVRAPLAAGPVLEVPIWTQYDKNFTELGHRIRRPRLTDEELALEAEQLADHLNRKLVCQERLDVWSETIAELADQGIEVIVVWMTLPDKRVDIYPGSREALAGIAAVVKETALGAGATAFVDLSDPLPEERYVDYNHLDGKGAKKFTRRLVRKLEARGL